MSPGNQRPELNVSDCAELIPGVRPQTSQKNGRPTLAEQGDFESRARLIHECEKAETKQDTLYRAIQSVDLSIPFSLDVDALTAPAVATPRLAYAVVTANAKDWPMLTTSDGWQIATEVALEGKDVCEETGYTWKDALMKTPREHKSSHSDAESRVKQSTRHELTKKYNFQETRKNDEDPNIMDYEMYKRLTRDTRPRFVKSTSLRPLLCSH